MVGFAQAKINIGLQIVGKRSDGYHDLETVFYPIPLYDVVEILPNPSIGAGEVTFISTGLEIPGKDEHNLCIKAYKLLHQAKNLPGITLYLHKTIPFGAGLAGGSSDAVQVLLLLNSMFQLHLTETELHDFAAQLGSDCPFFLLNSTSFARGTGNILEKLDLTLTDYHILLVKPDFSMSTKDAFSRIELNTSRVELKELIKQPVSTWKDLIKNDFESIYTEQYPAIARIKQELYDLGATYASLSGSGSSLYGIFERRIPLTLLKNKKFDGATSYLLAP